MSARNITPLSSTEKIARYTQAISSNTSNLITELNRVNAPAPPSTVENAAILQQLQTISEQLTKINTRLDALEQPSPTPIDHATVDVQNLELWCPSFDYGSLPTAKYVPTALISDDTGRANPNIDLTTHARVSTIPQFDTALTRSSLCTIATTSQYSASLQLSGNSHKSVFSPIRLAKPRMIIH